MNCRLQYPGFNMRIACFNPNLQDTQGCSQDVFPTNSIVQQREVSQNLCKKGEISFNFHGMMLINPCVYRKSGILVHLPQEENEG